MLVTVCCVFRPVNWCPHDICWSKSFVSAWKQIFSSFSITNKKIKKKGTTSFVRPSIVWMLMASKGLWTPHSTPLNNETVPQVLKQVVNLSCLSHFQVFFLFQNFFEHIFEQIKGPLSGLFYSTEKCRSEEIKGWCFKHPPKNCYCQPRPRPDLFDISSWLFHFWADDIWRYNLALVKIKIQLSNWKKKFKYFLV